MPIAGHSVRIVDQPADSAGRPTRERLMEYFSTRGAGPVTLDEALRQGIASDGGLFLPEKLPAFRFSDFDDAQTMPEVAQVLLSPFFAGSSLQEDLDAILSETFSFPIPATPLPVDGHDVSLLELYHGPTAAFKDVGAGALFHSRILQF